MDEQPGADPQAAADQSRQQRILAQLGWWRWPEVGLFLVLSLADIALTYVLIGYHGHIEANPVAGFFVDGWGLKGLAGFKFAMLAVILGLVHAIYAKRPMAARRVAQWAVLVSGIVVVYSVVLLARPQ